MNLFEPSIQAIYVLGQTNIEHIYTNKITMKKFQTVRNEPIANNNCVPDALYWFSLDIIDSHRVTSINHGESLPGQQPTDGESYGFDMRVKVSNELCLMICYRDEVGLRIRGQISIQAIYVLGDECDVSSEVRTTRHSRRKRETREQ